MIGIGQMFVVPREPRQTEVGNFVDIHRGATAPYLVGLNVTRSAAGTALSRV